MNIPRYISNPYKRIEATHFLVIFILIVNMTFFTQSSVSLLIQAILIVAVILHNKDDRTLKEQFEESQSQLREDSNIFDRNIIVSESDLEGNITYVNQSFVEISGYTEEELLGQPHSILRSQDMPKEFFKELWETIQSGETFHGVIKNIRKDGIPYWIDAAIIPITKNSNIVGYKAIRFDITDKILASENFQYEITQKDQLLQKQSTRFEFAINSSRDGFWDLDIPAKEFYLSSGWKHRLGFSEEDIPTYIEYLALMPDEDRFNHHEAMHEIIDNFTGHLEMIHFRIRYPLITKTGEKLLIEDVGNAFFDDKEELIRVTGFHRDITDQERQAKMIESQNRVAAMGDMVGNIAHQWRQPIGAINNTLNDLEFDIDLEDLSEIKSSKFLEVSNKIKEYTSYMSKTIDDFRSLASDEKVKTKFLVKEIVEEAHTIIEDEYKKYKIDFAVEVMGECKCEFEGYKRELLQVVINILNNAKDILVEKETENPRVMITLMGDEENVYLTIQDNAGGIPEAIINKIFDPYFTTKHESIGTGIGLFMSKKIIGEHFEGTLSVSNEDGGAKFTVSLPRQDT